MSLSEDLDQQIRQGMNPDVTVSIPISLNGINKHIRLKKNRMILIGGEPTAAKTTLAQSVFLTEPIEWYLKYQPKGVKLSVISFLMERKMVEYTSRWIARKIFEDTGDSIPSMRILGEDNNKKLTKGEYELVSSYYKMLDEWESNDLLIASQGSVNPSGIRKFIRSFAERHGTIHKKDKSDHSEGNILAPKEVYEPKHENHIVLIIGDNASVLDTEQDLTQGGLVNMFNKDMKDARDIFGFTPIVVQHLNRDISSTQRSRLGDLKPKLSDFADTSQTQKVADVVLALLNPSSHITKDSGTFYRDYDMDKMCDGDGLSYFRSLHILKNNFGAENVGYALGIHPTFGIMKTLPKVGKDKEVDPDFYKKVTSGEYFQTQEESIEKQAFKFGANK